MNKSKYKLRKVKTGENAVLISLLSLKLINTVTLITEKQNHSYEITARSNAVVT